MSVPGQVPGVTPGQVPGEATPTPTIVPAATPPPGDAPKTYDEAYVKTLRDEAAGHRTKLKAFEDAEKEREKAAMTEADRLKAELAEAKQASEAATTKARTAMGRAAVTNAAAKVGLDADVALAMVAVEFDAEGEPTGVDAAVAKLAKDKPHLLIAHQAPPASPTNPQRGPSGFTPDISTIPRLGERGLFTTGTG